MLNVFIGANCHDTRRWWFLIRSIASLGSEFDLYLWLPPTPRRWKYLPDVIWLFTCLLGVTKVKKDCLITRWPHNRWEKNCKWLAILGNLPPIKEGTSNCLEIWERLASSRRIMVLLCEVQWLICQLYEKGDRMFRDEYWSILFVLVTPWNVMERYLYASS